MNADALLRPAVEPDLPEILALLAEAALPTQGVSECIGEFHVLARGGRVIGAAAVEPYGKVGLLRSVVVAPGQRGRGHARALCERVVARAREHGLEALYLLTLGAHEYFARLGFRPLDRDEAPPVIRGSGEFRELCPDSATLMCKRLDGTT